MKVTYGTDLPITPEVAFAIVSDPSVWPSFIAGMTSAEIIDFWGEVGGRARTVISFLGRPVTSQLELAEWDPPHHFRYTMTQPGRPTLDHVRAFTAVEGGTRFVGSTEATPRTGVLGWFDRLQIRAVKRTMDESMTRLQAVVAERKTRTG